MSTPAKVCHAREFSTFLDCYAGFSEYHMLRLTGHTHSGVAMANCGIQFLASDSNLSNSTTIIQNTNDEKACTTLGFLSNSEEPLPVLAACLSHDIVSSMSTPAKVCHASHVYL